MFSVWHYIRPVIDPCIREATQRIYKLSKEFAKKYDVPHGVAKPSEAMAWDMRNGDVRFQ